MSTSSSFSFQIENPRGLALIIRYYQESDSHNCIFLNESLDALTSMWGLEKFQRKYLSEYHSHLQKYHDSIILVIEDKTNKKDAKIVGVVHLAIDNIIYNGEKIKVGHMGGLKIDKSYRQLNLEPVLLKVLEEEARKKDITLLDAWVLSGNNQELNIYKSYGFEVQYSQGFGLSSISTIKGMAEKLDLGAENKVLYFQEITKEEIIANWKEYYRDSNMVPHDWESFLKNYKNVQGYMVSSKDKSIRAGVVRVQKSQNATFNTSRFIFPSHLFSSLTFNGLILGLSSCISYGLHLTLSKITDTGSLLPMGVAGFVGFSLLALFHTAKKMVENKNDLKAMGKADVLVGPFYFGDEAYLDRVIGFLYSKVAEASNKKGTTSLLHINQINSPFLIYMPKSIIYSGKYLNKVIQNQDQLKGKSQSNGRVFHGFT